MAHYLLLESSDEEQSRVFADYTLGDSKLLPHYFGNIAPVNIFLGENNSGKSRFMRAIMKTDPAQIFDLGFSFEEFTALVNSTLYDTSVAFNAKLFDVEVTIQPSARDQATILAMVGIQNLTTYEVTKLKFTPCEAVEEVRSILEILTTAASTHKAFLDSQNSGELKKAVEGLQRLASSLKRVSNIYRGLEDRYFNGFRPNSIDNSSIVFAGQYGRITIHAGRESNELQNLTPFRQNLSKEVFSALNKVVNTITSLVNFLLPLQEGQTKSLDRTYIPTLRTARTLTDHTGNIVPAQQDIMWFTTRVDYKLSESKVKITTGLKLYSDINSKRNASSAGRKEFKKFRQFLSETFFDGKKVNIVPEHETTNILVKVHKDERILPLLGDGIQAIISLLYPLFTAPKGAWFFIEEPETHLHPGFQRLFIKTIATHKALLQKELTVFLTTHSNHLLDFALEEAKNINLFTFRKLPVKSKKTRYQVQLTAPHDLECLTALGVRNSSVFLSNCTIWVEGITDRIYLKAYLAAYLKHKKETYSLLEGLHYNFLEYAGANVAHYAFGVKAQQIAITDEAIDSIQALSISNRIMLIADRDANKETKHERLISQQHAGFEYVVLPTREIENLLSPAVIVGALKNLYPKADFDASKLQQEQYHDIYLGHYLRRKFTHIPEGFAPPKPKGSGTISSAKKRQFAEAAAEVMTEWDMLSPEAKVLTEQVFKFIIGHNPRLGSN